MNYSILIVLTPPFDPNAGGVQMTTWKMARYLSEHGHEVHVFSFAEQGHKAQAFAQLHAGAGASAQASRDNHDRLRRVIATVAPDVVINQMPYEHAIGDTLMPSKRYLLLGCLRNTLFSVKNNIDQYAARALPRAVQPLFHNRAGRRLLLERHRFRHRRDLERILATYDRFVMFGPPNLDELRYFVPDFDRERVALIPNSIPEVLPDVPTKERRLLWLGRLTYPQKRADLILPLWQRLSQSLPDWHFDIVGDGPALADLRRAIKQKGIERVTLHGRQPGDAYYKRASIFVMTSAFEGFPNTLVEAQSFAAIPVLFETFGVSRWMVNDGVDGHLIPPFDLDAMAARILAVAQADDAARAAIAKAALNNARRFHIDSVGAQWEALFDACLARRPEHHETRVPSEAGVP